MNGWALAWPCCCMCWRRWRYGSARLSLTMKSLKSSGLPLLFRKKRPTADHHLKRQRQHRLIRSWASRSLRQNLRQNLLRPSLCGQSLRPSSSQSRSRQNRAPLLSPPRGRLHGQRQGRLLLHGQRPGRPLLHGQRQGHRHPPGQRPAHQHPHALPRVLRPGLPALPILAISAPGGGQTIPADRGWAMIFCAA